VALNAWNRTANGPRTYDNMVLFAVLPSPLRFTGSFMYTSAKTTLMGCHPRFSSTAYHRPTDVFLGDPGYSFPVFRVLSSTLLPGFNGPESSVLSVDLPPSAPFPATGSPLAVRFYGARGNTGLQSRRASRGKTHRLFVSRPTSVRFAKTDIGTRSATTARPAPHTHIVGSLFATYTSSASCFLQTYHFWKCPCLVGLVLPSVTADSSTACVSCPAHVKNRAQRTRP
jgi:hypothetical protein